MIGERLRRLRLAAGRSLADVAEKCGISVATLSRVENDKQSIDVGLLLELASVLDVAPATLLEDPAGEGDGLVRRIKSLEPRQRAELWRELAGERRAERARPIRPRRNFADHVEELLAQVDMMRESIELVRSRGSKR